MSSTPSKKSPGAGARRPKPSSTSLPSASATRGKTTSNRRVVNSTVFETGSGNVFADVGLPDAEELLLKAQLMQAINAEITRRGVSQAEAGELVGLAQPDLSRIANGRGVGFSAERLMDVLRHLGRDVEILVSSASGPVGELRFRELAPP